MLVDLVRDREPVQTGQTGRRHATALAATVAIAATAYAPLPTARQASYVVFSVAACGGCRGRPDVMLSGDGAALAYSRGSGIACHVEYVADSGRRHRLSRRPVHTPHPPPPCCTTVRRAVSCAHLCICTRQFRAPCPSAVFGSFRGCPLLCLCADA